MNTPSISRRTLHRRRWPKSSRPRQARRSIGSPAIGVGPAARGSGLAAVLSKGPVKRACGFLGKGSRAAMAMSGLKDTGNKPAINSIDLPVMQKEMCAREQSLVINLGDNMPAERGIHE